MTVNQILDIIHNSEFIKDKNNKFGPSKSSKILCVFNDKEAYGFWIVQYEKDELIGVCKMIPDFCDISVDKLPENIDVMKVMWADDIKIKYGSIKNAVKNYK